MEVPAGAVVHSPAGPVARHSVQDPSQRKMERADSPSAERFYIIFRYNLADWVYPFRWMDIPATHPSHPYQESTNAASPGKYVEINPGLYTRGLA